MSAINQFFDKVFVINLARRGDRMQEFRNEFDGQMEYQRVLGFDHPTSGHEGCSRSHRTLLRKIADGPWSKVLVMEDDANTITKGRLKAAGFTPDHPVWKTYCSVLNGNGVLDDRFGYLSGSIPEKWDVLYLGASYGEPPISRYNSHTIRCGFMQTTSSYGITREFAKTWTAKVDAMTGGSLDNHPGPIDNVFGSMSHDHLYYVFQPRLLYQRKSMSDIEGIETCGLYAGTDVNPEHEGKFK